MDISGIRREQTRDGLSRKDLDPSPFVQYERWLKQVLDSKIPEPTAMSLATVSPEGKPRQRSVLLKAFDRRGFVFYTNLESVKAVHLTSNDAVSMLFYWAELERQVVIDGKAEKLSATR